jgi:hypothetical protein
VVTRFEGPPCGRGEGHSTRENGLGSRVSHSAGWLGSATEGRRPQVRGLRSGGSLALPARPQPPMICHPSWPDLEPGPKTA